MLSERVLEVTGLTGAKLWCAAADALGEVLEYLGCQGLAVLAQQHEIHLMLLGELQYQPVSEQVQQIYSIGVLLKRFEQICDSGYVPVLLFLVHMPDGDDVQFGIG